MISGGSWSVYWYNGIIVSSEIARGLDIYELLPSASHLAERDRRGQDGALRLPERAGAAEARVAAELRAGAAYLDQLERDKGLDAARITAVRSSLTSAEKQSGQKRKTALTQIASELAKETGGDQAKVKLLSSAVTDLAAATK